MSDVMALVQHGDGTFDVYDDTYDVVIHCKTEEEQKKAIERLKATNWIPVDEKLPDSGKPILVSFKNLLFPMIGRYTVDGDGNGIFKVTANEDESFVEHDLHVNAWMELPKCYKEGQTWGIAK